MTIAEQFRQEGVQQGMQQGMQQGKQAALKEVALNFLKAGLTIEQVAAGTNLPIYELEKLRLRDAS